MFAKELGTFVFVFYFINHVCMRRTSEKEEEGSFVYVRTAVLYNIDKYLTYRFDHCTELSFFSLSLSLSLSLSILFILIFSS
jgi:hypothetical protein